MDGDGNLTEESIQFITTREHAEMHSIKTDNVDDELNETVKYLVKKAKEKLMVRYSEEIGKIESLNKMDPIEALILIRENKML